MLVNNVALNYAVQPEFNNRLGGLLLSQPLPLHSTINIAEKSRTIKHCIPVIIKLYVTQNTVTISFGEYRIYGTAKIKKFANMIGIMNQSALIYCLFRTCEIVETIAETTFYFHSFEEENILKTLAQL